MERTFALILAGSVGVLLVGACGEPTRPPVWETTQKPIENGMGGARGEGGQGEPDGAGGSSVNPDGELQSDLVWFVGLPGEEEDGPGSLVYHDNPDVVVRALEYGSIWGKLDDEIYYSIFETVYAVREDLRVLKCPDMEVLGSRGQRSNDVVVGGEDCTHAIYHAPARLGEKITFAYSCQADVWKTLDDEVIQIDDLHAGDVIAINDTHAFLGAKGLYNIATGEFFPVNFDVHPGFLQHAAPTTDGFVYIEGGFERSIAKFVDLTGEVSEIGVIEGNNGESVVHVLPDGSHYRNGHNSIWYGVPGGTYTEIKAPRPCNVTIYDSIFTLK